MNPNRLLVRSVLAAILMMASGPPVLAQLSNAGRPKTNQVQRPRAGFMDYALGKINPEHRDYGSEVELMRRYTVEETINKAYFWSNVFSLSLLASVTTLYLLTLRSADKKELITATLIAELWNGLISSREEIERIDKDNRAILSRNREIEQSLERASNVKSAESRADTRTQRKVDRLIDGPRVASVDSEMGDAVDPTTPKRMGKSSGGVAMPELQQRNVLLERQIEAMRNTEQNLKERLNQTTVLLDQERKRNQALKGA